MPATTTITAVQKIIEYDTVLIPDLQPFIDSAVILVTAVVDVAPAPSDEILEAVTRYLVAHLVGITDPRLQSEQVKSLAQSYQFKLGMGLALTHHGSMAMLFDTTGRLARYSKQLVDGTAKLQFFWSAPEVT